jgi:DNA-binding NtrC family response regulator
MLAALARRNWPGNVRELRNEISRLCVLSEGDLDDTALVSRPATLASNGLDVKEIIPIAELEKRAINNAIEKTGGDKRKAAELLGISRAKIYQRLKDWEEGRK